MVNETVGNSTRVLISLKKEGTMAPTSEEITLFEVTECNQNRSYFFEIRDSFFSEKTTKRDVSTSDVVKLLDYVRDMKLPINPKREYWCDTSDVSLEIFNKKYLWTDPVPHGWEPLELIIKWLEVLSEIDQYRRDIWKKLKLKKLRIINLRKHYPYSLTKNYVLYLEKLKPAGLNYNELDAKNFVKLENIWIELEREPTNKYDPNAIKIVGCSVEDSNTVRRHLGYIPREYAAVIVKGKYFKDLKVYLHRTYYDYRMFTVYIDFDLAGPMDRQKEFQDSSKPKKKLLDIVL